MEQLRKTEVLLVMEGEEDEEGGGSSSKGSGDPSHCMGSSLVTFQGELEKDAEMETRSLGPSPQPDKPKCPRDELYLFTRELLLGFFKEYGGREAQGPVKFMLLLGMVRPNKALQTLLRVGREITERHRIPFQAMLTRLAIRGPEDLRKLSLVSSLVFSDGITNWGRIATLLSFGAFMAKRLENIIQEDGIAILADILTKFLMTAKRNWTAEHKGWDGFVEFFQVRDCENGVRITLMAFAGVAGLGASLAYLIP